MSKGLIYRCPYHLHVDNYFNSSCAWDNWDWNSTTSYCKYVASAMIAFSSLEAKICILCLWRSQKFSSCACGGAKLLYLVHVKCSSSNFYGRIQTLRLVYLCLCSEIKKLWSSFKEILPFMYALRLVITMFILQAITRFHLLFPPQRAWSNTCSSNKFLDIFSESLINVSCGNLCSKPRMFDLNALVWARVLKYPQKTQ